ncbi:caprin-1-like [Clytia hemisphaerica]|uniref:Caprin-1 dimerization domain-containing protein n=1 Tax=Clytia hemisphaerica TaxID=252671 RepID=A0A7M5XCK9_9CNID
MPSASSKPQASQQQVATVDILQEPIKSALSVADKKLRNLEKRRLKLLETKKKADKGEELNDDQKIALKNLEAVDFGLEAVKDVRKLISALEGEYAKLIKKDQKRQKQEQKDALENRSQKYVFDVVDAQAILGEMTEDVRPDFLAGANGACLLTETELENLDGIYELINPASSEEKSKKLSERSRTAGQHLVSLVEGKNSAAVEEVTYKDINDILQKIKTCGYFDKESSESPAAVEETEALSEEQKPVEAEVVAEPEPETPVAEESPVQEVVETAPVEVEPVNGVDLPPEVQTTPEEEGIKFMGESEISAAVQEAPLNPVSPEFVPRKMQNPAEDGFEGGETNNSDWQQIESGHSNHQGGNYRGRGRGRGRGGGFRGRGGNRDGSGNYRGGNREYRGDYRGARGGNRGGSGNYRGNREGGRGNFRGGNREGGRGNYRGDRGGHGGNQQQQQQQ